MERGGDVENRIQVYIYVYMYYEISLVNRSVFREKVNALRKNKGKRGIRDIKN